MRKVLIALLALLVAAVAAARAGEDGAPPIKLSDWKLARFRYGQGDKTPKKVEAEITVTNTGKENLGRVQSRLIYYASTGENVKETRWQFALVIPAGQKHTFKYVEGFVPAFEAYELQIQYTLDGKQQKHVYRSPDPQSLPELWSDEPVKGVSRLVIVGREVTQDPRTRRPKVYLRVKNLGEKPSTGSKVVVEFLGENARVVYTFEKKLGDGVVAGGAEKTYNYVVPKAIGGYAGCRVKLKADTVSDEDALSGGVFSDAREIELAHFKFTRKPDRSVYIVAKIRNGRKEAVTSPTAIIKLTDKSSPPKTVKQVPFEVTGRLEPGEVREFAVNVPECPSFGGFSYEIEYAERTEPTFKPVTAEVAPGKVGVSRVEIGKGPKGELRFTATVLSRAPHDVTEIRVIFTLLGGPRAGEVGRLAGGADKLAAGKSTRVVAELVKPPKFSNFTFKINYREPTEPKKVLRDRKKLPE